MAILDIHTHFLPKHPLEAIRNIKASEFNANEEGYYSVGVHPWDITTDQLERQLQEINRIANNKSILALGETGLDKFCKTPFDIQILAFEYHLALAESLHKPLIIHCVGRMNEMIRLKQSHSSDIPWIIHGFRGKKELASQLLVHGFYLSFGEKYQEEVMRVVPLNTFFLETDESRVEISSLYQKAAKIKQLPLEILTNAVQRNLLDLFS